MANPTQTVDVVELIEAIETAFAHVPRGTISLHEAEVIDDYGSADERARARARASEDDWRDVRDASLEACPNALPHLDPISWRFYLPACMRFALRTLGERRRFHIDRVIYTLCLYDDRRLNDHARARFRLLDPAQVDVVCRFLEVAASEDERCDAVVAAEALGRYWRRAREATST